MADLLTPAHALPDRWTRLRPAVRIAVIYALSRVATTLLLLLASAAASPQARFGAGATIGDYAVGWDAQWYWLVAVSGYPTTLPLTDAGQVAENAWAFLPLYPYLSHAVGFLLGGWGAGAVIVSLVAGYLSCLVLFRLLRPHTGESAGLWAVVFFASGPLAALFQIGYAEALFLLFLFLALLVVQERRYAWLYLLVPVMGFTRPGVLAFALFLALHGGHRWIARRREPLPVRHIVHIVCAGLLAAAVGFAWQLIAAVATGRSSAYLDTELAWRRNWIPDDPGRFAPFEAFLSGARFWGAMWGIGPILGVVLLVVLVAATTVLLVVGPRIRRLGVDLRLWTASYLLYLLAVFFPQSSIFRLLLPVSPLWGAVALRPSLRWRIGVLVACLVGQGAWIYAVFSLAQTYWQVP